MEAAPQHGALFVSGRANTRAAIAYRDLWTEVQTAALGRHIDLTTEPDLPAFATRHV